MTTKARSFHLLLLWHGLLAGGYTIAWLTAEGGRALHQFTGYLVIGLLALRLVVAVAASEQSAWALPWPSRALWQKFRGRVMSGDLLVFLQRTPLMPLSGLVILAALVLAGVTGLAADWWKLEDLHEAIAEGSLALVLLHVALVALAPTLRYLNDGPRETAAARD